MTFNEALVLLKEGKKLSRSTWGESDGYLVFMPGMKNIWKIITMPTPNAGNHILSVEEIEAQDWKEYDHNAFTDKSVNFEVLPRE